MLNRAPNRPQQTQAFVDKTGVLTRNGRTPIDEMWQQIAGGFPIVPCRCSGVNALVLTPILNAIGGDNVGNYMMWSFVASDNSTGALTAQIGSLPSFNVYKTGGSAGAGGGDIAAGRLYLLTYNSALNTNAGGFVLTAM